MITGHSDKSLRIGQIFIEFAYSTPQDPGGVTFSDLQAIEQVRQPSTIFTINQKTILFFSHDYASRLTLTRVLLQQ